MQLFIQAMLVKRVPGALPMLQLILNGKLLEMIYILRMLPEL